MSTAPHRVEICHFPGGKRLAVTTSWDDGRVYDRRIVAAFNEWGLKGTFNLNSGKLTRTGQPAPADSTGHLDASEIAELFKGHEVAVHSVTHPWLERLDISNAADEVLADRKALEDLVGYPVRGMAYPFGTYNQKVIDMLRGLGIVYSRTVENSDHPFPAKEPLAWPATCHKFHPELLAKWEALYNNQWATGRVFFVWGHSYEFAGNNRNWAMLEQIFKPLAGKPDVWYCTNIELFDYDAARQRMVVAANRRTARNLSGLTVTLNVDGKLLDVPPGQTVKLDQA